MPITRFIYAKSPWYNDQEMSKQLSLQNFAFYVSSGTLAGYLYVRRLFQQAQNPMGIVKWAMTNKTYTVPLVWIGGCAVSFALTGGLSLVFREIHRQKDPYRVISTERMAADALMAGTIGMAPWCMTMGTMLPSGVQSTFKKTTRMATRIAAWGLFWYTCTYLYHSLRMQYVMRLIRQRAEIDERMDDLPDHLRRSYWEMTKDWWKDNKPMWMDDQSPQGRERAKREEAVDQIVDLHEQAVEELRQERDELMRRYRDKR